jgi:MYXO-CTERM domain-containing protein
MDGDGVGDACDGDADGDGDRIRGGGWVCRAADASGPGAWLAPIVLAVAAVRRRRA